MSATAESPDFDPHAEDCPDCEAPVGACCEDWCAMCKQLAQHTQPATPEEAPDARA